MYESAVTHDIACCQCQRLTLSNGEESSLNLIVGVQGWSSSHTRACIYGKNNVHHGIVCVDVSHAHGCYSSSVYGQAPAPGNVLAGARRPSVFIIITGVFIDIGQLVKTFFFQRPNTHLLPRFHVDKKNACDNAGSFALRGGSPVGTR